MNDLSVIAKEAEAFETPEWAANAILDREILTEAVIDPCAGRGVLGRCAEARGYHVASYDKYEWDHPWCVTMDFFDKTFPVRILRHNTVLMNPPFSLAQEFVERCLDFNARKIVCFQRFAWWESKGRREFWQKHPPNRIYICGDRASCWRFDIPKEEQKSSTTTAHAWFVWERGHPPGTVLGHIYK